MQPFAAALQLKHSFFWNVTPRHWVVGVCPFDRAQWSRTDMRQSQISELNTDPFVDEENTWAGKFGRLSAGNAVPKLTEKTI